MHIIRIQKTPHVPDALKLSNPFAKETEAWVSPYKLECLKAKNFILSEWFYSVYKLLSQKAKKLSGEWWNMSWHCTVKVKATFAARSNLEKVKFCTEIKFTS